MPLRDHPTNSALSGATENVHYAELGIRFIFISEPPKTMTNLANIGELATETFSESFSKTFSKGVVTE
jgi:hypothetical protein